MTADNPEQMVPSASAPALGLVVSPDDTSSAADAGTSGRVNTSTTTCSGSTSTDGGPDPDPSPGPSIPLQRSASEARGAQSAAAAAAAQGGSGQESPGKRNHHHRRAHTTMSSSVASGAAAGSSIDIGSSDHRGGGGGRSSASGAAGDGPGPASGSSASVDGKGGATTALRQQQHEEQDVPKVKLNIPGKNEDEVVVKRKGRFKILKDTAVTVVAPGPAGGSGGGHANDSAAAGTATVGKAPMASAISDGSSARAGESSTSAVSSAAPGGKVQQQASSRGSPNKPPFPNPHTRSKSDSSAATSGSANAPRGGVPAGLQGGVKSAASLASAAVGAAESTLASGSGASPAVADTRGNDRVQLTAGTVTVGAAGTSSATTSPMNVVETITPAASFSPSIQQPHLGASPIVAGNVTVKQKGRFSITPASEDTAGLVAGGAGAGAGSGSGDPLAPSLALGGGIVASSKRPPQYLQQPRLPPKHQNSQDSETMVPLAPSVDTGPRDCDEKMQRSPSHEQSTEAPSLQQQQQQQQQSKAVINRQSLVQQQQGASGPQNVQEHPSQPAGLFPEKHARAMALSGGTNTHSAAGRPGGQPGGLGKVCYFIEQMKIEVTEADKTMKQMQTDMRLLREKNKELERKHTEEKLARETAEAKVRSLKKRIRELKEQVPDGAVVPEGMAKSKKMNEGNGRGDESKNGEASAASGDPNNTVSAEQRPKARARQGETKSLPRTSSLSPKREVEERYSGKGTHPLPKILDSTTNSNSKSTDGKRGKGQAGLLGNDTTKEGKATKPRESTKTGSTAGNIILASGPKKPATNVNHSLASSPRNNPDQQSMAKRNIDAALNALGGGGKSQGQNDMKADSPMPVDSAQLQHIQQQNQQQQQQQQMHQQPPQMRMSHVNYDSDSGTTATRSLHVAAGSIPSSIHLRTSSIGPMDPMTLPMPGSAAPATPAVATIVSFDPLGAPPPDQQISAGQGQIAPAHGGSGGGGGGQQHMLGSNPAMHNGPSQYVQQQQWPQTQASLQQQQWVGQQHAVQQPHQPQQAQSQSTAYEYQQQISAPPPVHSQYQQYQQIQNIAENPQPHFQLQQPQQYVPSAQSQQGFQGQQQLPQNPTTGNWNNRGG